MTNKIHKKVEYNSINQSPIWLCSHIESIYIPYFVSSSIYFEESNTNAVMLRSC